MKKIINTLWPGLSRDDPLSSQSLGKYRTDNLTRSTKKDNTYQRKLTIHKKEPK